MIIKQYDLNIIDKNYQEIEVFFDKDLLKITFYVLFFTENSDKVGSVRFSQFISNEKIMWDTPYWISQSTMDYCDKLLTMKVFL